MNLIFLDSEGTIRINGKTVNNLNEIFSHYEKNNVIPILTTGLPRHLILSQYKDVYNFKYLITSNGAQITDTVNNKTLFYAPIDVDILPFLVEERKHYRFHLKATILGEEYTTNMNYVDEHTHYLQLEEIAKLKNYCQVYLKVDLDLSLEEMQKEILSFDCSNLSLKEKKKYNKLLQGGNVSDIYKFVACKNISLLREKIKAFNGIVIGNDSENFYNFDLKNEDTWLSINKVGISKYSAIDFLTNHLGVDTNEIIVVGNDTNDDEMLLKSPFAINIINRKRNLYVTNGINIKEKNIEFVLYYLLAYLNGGFSVSNFKKDIINELVDVPLIARLSDAKNSISNLRFASRGIVINEKDEVILFYKERIGEIKLPGGGLEEKEKPIEAFRREVREETGFEITDIKLIGYTIERKRRNDFKQVSFVFAAKALTFNNPSLTLEESINLGKGVYCPIEIASLRFETALLELKNLNSIDLYHEKFIVRRDKKIFIYFRRRIKK